MVPRALKLGALVALTLTAIAVPVALGQSPDPAPTQPTLSPDPAPDAAPAPAPPSTSAPQPTVPAAPTAPTEPAAAPQPAPAPSAEQPAAPPPAPAQTRATQPRERKQPARAAGAGRERPKPGPKADPSIPRAAFLQVDSLLPRGDRDPDDSNTMLILAAGALLALAAASGSFASILARLMPPTAVLVLLLAAPTTAQAGTITPNCDTPGGARDTCSHWYTASPVSLSWTVEPGGTRVSGCDADSFSRETAPAYRECKWSWSGSVFTATVWIGIDRTAPRITGLQPARPPDHNGWFNRPVGLKFKGSDALSGVRSCSETTYSGPDGADIFIGGSCTDVAGNTGSGFLPINYDATPPPAPSVKATPRDRAVRIEWTPAFGANAEVARFNGGGASLVYRGQGHSFTDTKLRNGRRYRYVVTLVDQAGNKASGDASAVPTASPLLTPALHEKVRRPPLLTWRKVRKATYYNVQLFRSKRKVLSRWPRANEYQLRKRWRFGGKTRRLSAGRYCYAVWPGYGPRRERDYGRMLGKRCFRVTR